MFITDLKLYVRDICYIKCYRVPRPRLLEINELLIVARPRASDWEPKAATSH